LQINRDKTFIGLDLGTTSIKGAILDVNEMQIRETLALPFPHLVQGLGPGYSEVEPREVLSAVRLIIRQLLSHTTRCSGLVMCSQMHGLVVVNEIGEPVSNIITWRDDRALQPHYSGAGTFYDVLSNAIGQSDKLRVGNNLAPNRPLTVLYTEIEKSKHGDTVSFPSNAIPMSLPDLVLSSLCHSSPCTDVTNAAASSVFDWRAFDWHHEIISTLGLNRLNWPRIAKFGEIVGYYEIDRHRVPCHLPIGDQQCSLLGSLLAEGELSLNISTGSQVSMISKQLNLSESFQTVPYFDGTFLKTVVNVPAGRALNALISLLSELARAGGFVLDDPWTYIEHAVALTGDTNMTVDLAFFPSSCGDRGSIQNITEDTLTIGHLFAAAFKGMARNYSNCALRISPTKDWNKVVLSGGLAVKSEALKLLICDTFKSHYRLAPSESDSALMGLLILASVFSEKFGSTAEAVLALREACV
jgi:sugar (pentulose or hexulose) kinase